MNQLPFQTRRQALYKVMKEGDMLVFFAGTAVHRSADAHYPFSVNRNFYYLTGIDAKDARLVAIKTKREIRETLYIARPDPEREKWDGYMLTADQAKDTSGVERIQFLDQWSRDETEWLVHDHVKTVLLDLEPLHSSYVHSDAHHYAKEMSAKHPYLRMDTIHEQLWRMRMIKDETEIAAMRKAIEITHEGLSQMLAGFRPGEHEYAFQARFDYALRLQGARENAFESIVAGGARATVLHYIENQAAVQDGELVLFDLGAAYRHYCADISRTFPVSGEFSERQRQVYDVVCQALEETTAKIKPGVSFTELNDCAKTILADGLMRIGVMATSEQLSQYYYHSVGHYLGLDTHDVGDRKETLLEPGMVITVEPGLYIAEWDIGIRLEDDVLVTEDGHDVLSKAIPRRADDVLEWMKNMR